MLRGRGRVSGAGGGVQSPQLVMGSTGLSWHGQPLAFSLTLTALHFGGVSVPLLSALLCEFVAG